MQNAVPYSQAVAAKFPEQIVIGIAREPSGKCNPITLGWTMITSGSPPMMAVSIGLPRHSLEVFRAAEGFVIAMPTADQYEETMLFGTRSGRDTDKFAEAGTPLADATEIDCQIMADAVANFECRKTDELLTGDHVIFVGEVVAGHVHPDAPDRLYTVGPGYEMAPLPRGAR